MRNSKDWRHGKRQQKNGTSTTKRGCIIRRIEDAEFAAEIRSAVAR